MSVWKLNVKKVMQKILLHACELTGSFLKELDVTMGEWPE